MESRSPELAAVIAAYHDESSIDEFHRRLSDTLGELGRSYEIVYVNDGSRDATWTKIEALFERDDHVTRAIDLDRNSGKEAALTAATAAARGDKLVYIDCDLQLDPEDLPRALAEFDRGFDIVSGYRTARRDSLLRTAVSPLANAVWRRRWRTRLRDLGCHFWIIDGRLMRDCEFGPTNPIRLETVLARSRGASEVAVGHHPRPHGRSTWSVAALVRYFVGGLIGTAPGHTGGPAYTVRRQLSR